MRDHRSNGYYDDEEEGYEQDGYYDDEEEEEEEVKRSPPKPTKEEREFLSYRERLKEKYRQKQQGQGRTPKQKTSSIPDKKNGFGSFFGPALPVIAPRVIEESKSIKETHHRAPAKAPSSSAHHKGGAPLSSMHKPSNGHTHRPKVNEAKKKAQTLKEARDFSFLFDDDADLPEQKSTNIVPKSSSHPKPDRRSAAHASSSRAPPSKNGVTANARSAPSNGGRPTGQRPPVQRQSNHDNRSAAAPSSSRQAPPPQSNNKQRPVSVSVSVSQNGGHRVSTSAPSRKPSLPPSKNKAPPPPPPVKGKQLDAVRKNPNSAAGPSTSRPSSSLQRRPVPPARMDSRPDKARPAARPGPSSSSRPPQPSKQMTASGSNDRRREQGHDAGKKRPARRPFEDEEDDAMGMLRQMIRKRYNPEKWREREEEISDSDMEVGFDVIQKEERYSSKQGRIEDEEQLRLIEEEERRERMRKKQKMRHG